MDQNEYPQPNIATGPYPKDLTWGTVIIVLSALGICCGVAGVGAGGVLGAVGAGAATSAAAAGSTADARQAAAAAGVGGGVVMLLGIGIIISSALQLVGGVGIRKGLRWGFLLTAVMAAISLLLNLGNLPQGILGILINGVILYYCYSRLSGKEGPLPA